MSVQAMRNVYVVNTRNRILSQHIRMSMNTRHTDLNNNILVIGGSGSGKTFRFVKPQLMQMFGSYIITDPKGELYRDTSAFLKQNGYEIKVLNLLDEEQMVKSIANEISAFGEDCWYYNKILDCLAFTKKEQISQEMQLKDGILDPVERREIDAGIR